MQRRDFIKAGGAMIALSAPGLVRAEGRPRVVISHASDGFLYVPIFVALAGDFFASAGVDAEFISIHGGAGTVAALVGGDVDAAYTSALQVPVARSNRVPLQCFAATVTRFQADLVVRDSLLQAAGVSAEDPLEVRMRALRGATIGVINHTGGPAHILRLLAEFAGLDAETDLTLAPIGDSAATIAAYGQGRIDGLIYSPPTSTIALNRHGGTLLASMSRGDYPEYNDFLYGALIGTEDWLRNRPEVAQATVTAIARAEALLRAEPETARAALRPFLSSIDDETFDAAFALNLPSFPPDPRMSRAQFDKVYQFLARTQESVITADPESCFTNHFADAAVGDRT